MLNYAYDKISQKLIFSLLSYFYENKSHLKLTDILVPSKPPKHALVLIGKKHVAIVPKATA